MESTIEREHPDPAADQVQPRGPEPTCTPGCTLAFPLTTNGPAGPYCWSLGQIDCEAAPGAWVDTDDVPPQCGEARLWMDGCFWNPAGGCEQRNFWVAWQTCE